MPLGRIFFASGLVLAVTLQTTTTAESLSDKFERAVSTTGKSYVTLREELLSKPKGLRALLKQKAKAQDWKTRLQARILRGWLDEPTRYAALWSWKPPENGFRNPFPRYQRDAKGKFQTAGKGGLPLILELVWKKHETQYGVLPELLYEMKVPEAFPVLVDWLESGDNKSIGLGAVPHHLAPYKEKATPHLIKALKSTEQEAQKRVVLGLGETGDPKAIPALQQALVTLPYKYACSTAVVALDNVKRLDTVRESFDKIQHHDTRMVALEYLHHDESEATRKLLFNVARSAEDKELRIRAVRSLMREPKMKTMPLLEKIIDQELEPFTKSIMVLWLSNWDKKDPELRKLFLKLLKDKQAVVRMRAIEALEPHDKPIVTKALIPFLKSEDEHIRRLTMYALYRRKDPEVGKAAVPMLKDKNYQCRLYALEAIVKNPTKTAVPRLVELLQKGVYGERNYSAKALSLIGGEQAKAALKKAIENEKDEGLRRSFTLDLRRLEKREPKP